MEIERISGKWLVALWAISTLCALAIGVFLGIKSMYSVIRVSNDDVQAMLASNNISNEHHLHDLLNKGCASQASEFVDFLTDTDMSLLHGYLKGHLSKGARDYIEGGNPVISKEAESYSPKFPNASWQERACG